METSHDPIRDPAADRLAGELADVEAAISLVSEGAVSSVTLTRLRFGQQLADHLHDTATRAGVRLEAAFWPEDSAADVLVAPLEHEAPIEGDAPRA